MLLSRLDAKLHVADVRAELITLGGAVRCSVLRQKWEIQKKTHPIHCKMQIDCATIVRKQLEATEPAQLAAIWD